MTPETIDKIRKDFPVLKKGIVYLDSACMSLKPQQVIDKLNEYYSSYTSCAGRSAHILSERLEEEIMKTREQIKSFINARSPEEIIFTRNTTESINIIARGLPLGKGDEVIISDKEHNSNLIPWLRLVKEKGIVLKIIPSNPDNTFSIEQFKKRITKKTKLVSIAHVSNLDGVANPIREITRIAHDNGSLVMIDAAQSAPHKPIDVKQIGCDFLVFSGHKALGPTGTGVLYGKKEILEDITPLVSGGGTVLSSTYTSFVEEKGPARFEAGLQDYSGIIGLGEACKYLKKISFDIEKHEQNLNKIVSEILLQEPYIECIGPRDYRQRSGIFSFNIIGLDPLNVARILSAKNIFVRGGMHCVHSWFNAHKIKGSVRASFYIYNTEREAHEFVSAVKEIAKLR